MISNLAYIHPDAKLGANVTVEPFAYIAGDTVIGDDCWIGPGAVIHDGARIGKRCRIHTAASVACLPQDLKFAGEITTCEIGDDNDIREYVTISRGTASTGTTRIGSKNLLMAYVHIGHDCIIGSNCVIANRVSLAGEVHVGDWVVIGGHAAVHQWTHIGAHAMVQGGALLGQDLPPYVIVRNDTLRFAGINKIGLARRGFSHERIAEILPHPLPERPELPERLRRGRKAGSAKSRARYAPRIHPHLETRHHQTLRIALQRGVNFAYKYWYIGIFHYICGVERQREG
mgnify:CR=1 FL=1